MQGTRYRRGGCYAADMAAYARLLSEENTNSETVRGLKRNLVIALRQELTEAQRAYIQLYYGERMTMKEIGRRYGVDKSTVSRTIQRGEARLRRCLRFGAANLLDLAGVETPYRSVRNHAKREGYENI